MSQLQDHPVFGGLLQPCLGAQGKTLRTRAPSGQSASTPHIGYGMKAADPGPWQELEAVPGMGGKGVLHQPFPTWSTNKGVGGSGPL